MGMRVSTKRLLDLPAFATEVEWSDIQDWASEPGGGSLPDESARAFATWLNEVWDDYTEDATSTVKDVLEGAVTQWCGGRTF